MIEVGTFALKALIVVLSLGSLIILVAVMAARAAHKPELEVEPLHQKFDDIRFFLKGFTASKDELKAEKKKRKEEKKAEKNDDPSKRIFVLDFDGDVNASAVDNLREEITAILLVAEPKDEVVLKVESPGGVVHGYGLAASQLLRIRERGIPLTVCVDAVAASGGYLMSCVANQIIAAPFSVIGSIGVVAQVPNFHRILKKNDVDFKEYTAGEFKRTVSIFGEITPKGEEKFVSQLESTHQLFKKFVGHYRPQVDMAKVATGEFWFGSEAKDLGLVDKLQTSDDYLYASAENDAHIYELCYMKKQSLQEKISDMLGMAVSQSFTRIWSSLEKKAPFI